MVISKYFSNAETNIIILVPFEAFILMMKKYKYIGVYSIFYWTNLKK